MVNDKTHGLIRDGFCIGGARAAPPAVLLGATRIDFGAKAVHAVTVIKVTLQDAGFVSAVLHFPEFLLRTTLAIAQNLSSLRCILV